MKFVSILNMSRISSPEANGGSPSLHPTTHTPVVAPVSIEIGTTKHDRRVGLKVELLTGLKSLPMELRQEICKMAITPFQPINPEQLKYFIKPNGCTSSIRMLGYILDPYGSTEFRKQRNKFREELECLQELGEHVELGLDFVESKWREDWKTSMSEVINRDLEEWRKCLQKGERPPTSAVFQRDFTIQDVYAHVEQYVEAHWANWGESLSTSTGERECRQRAMADIVQSLRTARVFSALDGHGSIPQAMKSEEAVKEMNARFQRNDEIADIERMGLVSNGPLGLSWTPGLQKAVRWESDD